MHVSTVAKKDEVAARYNRMALLYDAVNFTEPYVSKYRKKLLRRARGSILEVGVGTGNSFKDYPPGSHVLAVDISKGMLQRAREKLKSSQVIVELRREDVQKLPFENDSFDTVFTSLVFCTVADPMKGLVEIRRVLKRNGQLLMLEHVRSRKRALGYIMDKINPIVARYGIDNINRDTVANLRKAGFKVRLEKNLVSDVVKAIVAEKYLTVE